MINKKRLIFVLIILAIILAVAFSSNIIGKFFHSSDVFELEFQKGISYRLENYKNDVLFINNEEISCVNDRGEIIWTVLTGISDPAVSIKGEYILLSDIGGGTVFLIKEGKVLHKFQTNNTLLCAKVNKNGNTLLVTTETGYKGLATIYGPNGEEKFKWHSGNGYIADADISSKNNLIISQISTKGSFVNSNIIFFNTKRNKKVECASYENCLISHLQFNVDNSFIVLSDDFISGFSSKCKEKYKIDFEGRVLKYYNTDYMNNVVLSFKGNVNDTIIEAYTRSGKLKGSYRPNDDIVSVDVNGELILLASGRKLSSLSPSGKVKTKKELTLDINKVKIFNSRKKAVILSGNNAMVYNIY